jgi:hypothetical protein
VRSRYWELPQGVPGSRHRGRPTGSGSWRVAEGGLRPGLASLRIPGGSNRVRISDHP